MANRKRDAGREAQAKRMVEESSLAGAASSEPVSDTGDVP